MTPEDRKLIAYVYVRTRRDAPDMDGMSAAKFTALLLNISGLDVLIAIGMNAIQEPIGSGRVMKAEYNGDKIECTC